MSQYLPGLFDEELYFDQIEGKEISRSVNKKKGYFVTKIVLSYCEKNCSTDQEKTFEIRG